MDQRQKYWQPALDQNGKERAHAWVINATEILGPTDYPAGTNLYLRAEPLHPGAQPTMLDADGHRITAFLTNSPRWHGPTLDARHRARGRCENRIKTLKNNGLGKLPFFDFPANQAWATIAALAMKSGLRYLFKTTMIDDLSSTPPDATTYYMKAGTPEGRWIGRRLKGIDRTPGDAFTESDARAVFDLAIHPDTGTQLGRPHSQPTAVVNKTSPPTMRQAVVGFDLTFSVPKSLSVLWALSPRSTQDHILRTHHDAVEDTLTWLEENVIHTRAGRNGVAHLGTMGAIAAAFDHWESRLGDPQLHTHVVIANRIQRITDGAWVTLDSRTLYKAAVAASEHYNGLYSTPSTANSEATPISVSPSPATAIQASSSPA